MNNLIIIGLLWLLTVPAIAQNEDWFRVASEGVPAASGSFTYFATGFNTNGSGTANIRKASAFTGIADSQVGSISFWIRAKANDGSTGFVIEWGDETVANPFQIIRTAGNFLEVSFRNAANAAIANRTATTTTAIASGWQHVLISWNLATPTIQFYINDVDAGGSLVGGTGTVTWSSFATGQWTVANGRDNGEPFWMGISEVWFTTTSIDFSVSGNRALFSSGGHPISLGANGSTPTGTQPLLYLNGQYPAFNVNAGSGGNFVTSGTPVDMGSDKP